MQDRHTGPDPDDGLHTLLLAVLFLAGISYLAWAFLRPEIAQAVLTANHWLMQPAHLLTDRYASLDAQVLAADPNDEAITFGTLWQLAHDVGLFWRAPVAIALLGLAGCCLWKSRGHHRRDLDLPGLMAEHAKTFRHIAPYVRRRLGPVDPAPAAPRPADPALHLREWIDRFARDPAGAPNPDLAREELARQLGTPWTGLPDAAPHVRAMFAVFALHAVRRREDAAALLGDLAESLPDGRDEGPEGPLAPLEFSRRALRRAERWLRDPEVTGPCEIVASGHGWTHTALMSALCFARQQAGVLNPGTFAWLQMVDRRLFFALDSLGPPTPGQPWHRSAAQAPYAEAIAAREHWTAEREALRPIRTPMVEASAAAVRAGMAQDAPVTHR